MRKHLPLQVLACLSLFVLLQLSFSGSTPEGDRIAPEMASRLDAELARMHRALRHAPEHSAEAAELREKIEKRRRALEGRPEAGHANEFARVLWEMKIPADRSTPGYESGYREKELREARRLAKAGPALPWISRGPGNVAGRARALIVDPSDASENTWLVGSAGGGVWKTTDAGASWSVLTDGLPNLPVSALAMSPANPDVIYGGTGESFYNIDTINGNGLIKSTDGGSTWAPIATTVGDPRFNNIARIIVDPSDENVLVVAATTGRYKEDVNPSSSILRSTDGGQTWNEVYTETDTGSFGRVKKVQQVIASPADFSLQFAAIDEKGILKSTDAGQTWTLSNNGISAFDGRFELAFVAGSTDDLLAAAEGGLHSELYVSTDGGANWIETVEQSGNEPNWLGAQGWYDNTLVGHPTNPDVVFVGGIRLWRIEFPNGLGTVDRGNHLHQLRTGARRPPQSADPEPRRVLEDPQPERWGRGSELE